MGPAPVYRSMCGGLSTQQVYLRREGGRIDPALPLSIRAMLSIIHALQGVVPACAKGEGLSQEASSDDGAWNDAAQAGPDRTPCWPAGPAETPARSVGRPSRQQRCEPGSEPCCLVL